MKYAARIGFAAGLLFSIVGIRLSHATWSPIFCPAEPLLGPTSWRPGIVTAMNAIALLSAVIYAAAALVVAAAARTLRPRT